MLVERGEGGEEEGEKGDKTTEDEKCFSYCSQFRSFFDR